MLITFNEFSRLPKNIIYILYSLFVQHVHINREIQFTPTIFKKYYIRIERNKK